MAARAVADPATARAVKPIPDDATEEFCDVIGRLDSLDDISDIVSLLS